MIWVQAGLKPFSVPLTEFFKMLPASNESSAGKVAEVSAGVWALISSGILLNISLGFCSQALTVWVWVFCVSSVSIYKIYSHICCWPVKTCIINKYIFYFKTSDTNLFLNTTLNSVSILYGPSLFTLVFFLRWRCPFNVLLPFYL